MIRRDEFKDEHGEPITLDFNDKTRLKTLYHKLKKLFVKKQ